jgi:hypothetical protein
MKRGPSLVGRCRRWVKMRKAQTEQMFSALLLNSDIARCSQHVAKVPNSDMALGATDAPNE